MSISTRDTEPSESLLSAESTSLHYNTINNNEDIKTIEANSVTLFTTNTYNDILARLTPSYRKVNKQGLAFVIGTFLAFTASGIALAWHAGRIARESELAFGTPGQALTYRARNDICTLPVEAATFYRDHYNERVGTGNYHLCTPLTPSYCDGNTEIKKDGCDTNYWPQYSNLTEVCAKQLEIMCNLLIDNPLIVGFSAAFSGIFLLLGIAALAYLLHSKKEQHKLSHEIERTKQAFIEEEEKKLPSSGPAKTLTMVGLFKVTRAVLPPDLVDTMLSKLTLKDIAKLGLSCKEIYYAGAIQNNLITP